MPFTIQKVMKKIACFVQMRVKNKKNKYRNMDVIGSKVSCCNNDLQD